MGIRFARLISAAFPGRGLVGALWFRGSSPFERELGSGQIVVSAIAAWEIAMLVEREMLVLSMDVASWLTTVSAVVDLPGEFHKVPADRMIVATARKLAVPLVTRDEKIRAYKHVNTIW